MRTLLKSLAKVLGKTSQPLSKMEMRMKMPMIPFNKLRCERPKVVSDQGNTFTVDVQPTLGNSAFDLQLDNLKPLRQIPEENEKSNAAKKTNQFRSNQHRSWGG